ncbi:hypothetical protein H4Q26_003386 [Puccinia striiformis f. sp. tritici PST-130]|nr:hypothetical protein H4Q26_003386 [Puccinia striiformis f. sp. tritici PST-130]
MSNSHQMEGYVVLASCDPRHPVLRTAGSIMAHKFLNILAEDTNQTNSLFQFVCGKQAVKDVLGPWPTPARTRKQRGGIDGDDADAAHCLGKATHGAWQSGWPGTLTATVLKSLGVTLSVQSRRVHTALANRWFKLTGPPAPDATVVGADDLTDLGDDSSDDNDDPPDGDLAVQSRPKKPLPCQKTKVAGKKGPAAPKPSSIKKLAAATKQATNKNSKKKATTTRGRRDDSLETSAALSPFLDEAEPLSSDEAQSLSSDEVESLVHCITRESSSKSSKSDASSFPSLPQP